MLNNYQNSTMLPTPTLLAETPPPPYFAVIFTSQRTAGEIGDMDKWPGARLSLLPSSQVFNVESGLDPSSFGMAVSYWSTEEAIAVWKSHLDHQAAQANGKPPAAE